jgi:hypothetical protein
MSIEWGITGLTSPMTFQILDNSMTPSDVLRAGVPFQIRIDWQVPPALASLIGPGDSFRLRAFAESIGPGQEQQLAAPGVVVPGVNGQLNYTATLNVNPNPLLGEEQLFGGVPVSGAYDVVCVLQHLNGGVPTVHSGVSDYHRPVFFRAP